MESSFFNVVITTLTIYALFGDDIRVAAFDKYADIGFDVVNIIALACIITIINLFTAFSIEILLSVFVKKDYFLSFFFWLDVISTISLILDI